MKRELDLCRKILIFVADNGELKGPLKIDIKGYSIEEIAYNLELLEEAGFLKLVNGNSLNLLIWGSLSWEGNEYLDAIRNDRFWEKAKKQIKDKIGSASFSVLLLLLNEYAKSQLFSK